MKSFSKVVIDFEKVPFPHPQQILQETANAWLLNCVIKWFWKQNENEKFQKLKYFESNLHTREKETNKV